jgi:polyhydroxybutyrate depolymerase
MNMAFLVLSVLVAPNPLGLGDRSSTSEQPAQSGLRRDLQQQLGPGDHLRTIDVDGRRRSYLIHVPADYNPRQPTPVVLAFHGALLNAEQMVHFCGLNEKADATKFLAVYPNGTGFGGRMLTWNAGDCCGQAERNNVDDVAFTRALLDDLATLVNVDAKRVYATGMSNGAMFVYRLAAELSDRIAAIAPVAGPMGVETSHPQRPVSVIHFHGDDDQFAPFDGGRGSKSLSQTGVQSVEHSIQVWARADGCPDTPAVAQMPQQVDDGTTVQRTTYGPGKQGAEVVLYTIKGGGHTWPGRDPAVDFLGKSTRNIVANDLIWEFFERHPMK